MHYEEAHRTTAFKTRAMIIESSFHKGMSLYLAKVPEWYRKEQHYYYYMYMYRDDAISFLFVR